MSGRDPDAECGGADHEPDRRAQVDRLPVDPGMHGAGAGHIERRRGLRSPRSPARTWCMEDDDAEAAALEGKPRGGKRRALQRVGVVGHEHDRRRSVSTPRSIAKWLRVPAGMQTNGSPCARAAAATTPIEPSPAAASSASAPLARASSISVARLCWGSSTLTSMPRRGLARRRRPASPSHRPTAG
jgi:hypothetical protein